ncbi:50S ribosomal protein L22 [Candidatus Roizmanbacteria bacterium RIFCSPLOWO2_01_FULL_40_14]|uniref:Large ribosomal subunit protein uL22 n=2 Tax=Candidatus Roizmaniibacteriota TaxID=1752723 RepID=A0A0G0T6R1_9BACT|nr:MAG: 50S ribosomal protein L22 [Candidatus Roizmanbacteria bacterium GW2011_GWB1_40_7]KKR94558.1 MAG: 50S ribosomal protein L22 [Candidatus Roizmanbacteria bacterium GW2011_GWA1_41_13]OGK48422.1 MAG: 50S ribosomal protein L22 [Candidatus Roizmanbacteria bacterium RIFCSPLOWO2_01_FULL_40_14]
MEIKSQSNYIRITPRKARLVASAVRHLPLERALITLERLPKRAAFFIKKTIESGIANAENNAKLSKDRLYIKQLTVDEGPRFKRWRAASRGTAHQYQKQTSHITVILDEMKESKVKIKNEKPARIATQSVAGGLKVEKITPKEEPKKGEKKIVEVKKGYREKIGMESKQRMKSNQYQKKATVTRKVIGGK